MSFKRKSMYALLLSSMLLAACGASTVEGESTLDVNAILTAGIGTLAASIFETQTALAPTMTQTALSTASPTNTALSLLTLAASPTQGFVFVPVVGTSSLSLTPTGTLQTPTSNPSLLAFGCNNLLLLSDVTIPAGTVMKPEETFTKTWKVANIGTCDWLYLYRLVFAGGNQLDGDPSGLGKVIPPAKWTQLSIALTAPKQPGAYTGSWRLGTQAGNAFGSTLTVSIVVASPTNTPVPSTSTPSHTPVPTHTPTPTDTTIPTDTPALTETPIVIPPVP